MSQYDVQSTDHNQGTIASLKTLEATPEGRLERWSAEITAAEKELKKFHDQARKVVQRYIDERDAINVSQKWLNVFYANTTILEAALYANIPTAEVSRKFFDMNDDVARVASNILQRAIQQDMSFPDCDFDQVMRLAVSDRLIAGLGGAWLRLETETEPQPIELGTTEDGEPLQKISHQEVCIDYVFWEDILWSPCRVWSERRWVARRVAMTQDDLVARFGEELGATVPMNYAPRSSTAESSTSSNMVLKRAEVFEIWDRETRKVIWFVKGMSQLLDEKEDPLGLEGFEPCPKPLFANLTTSNCLPKPDYSMIQDQYNELDEVNNRISLLVVACKVVGVYDRSADGIQRMLTEGYDNTLIPVDNWAMFAEKGGVKGQIDWLPLDVVVNALEQLQKHRESVKGQIYELTGINDIVRGATKASETLGAQELKAQFASVRIQKLQDEVTRFAEGILQIKADILIKHFDPVILAKMANVANTEDKELAIPALQLLKGDSEAAEWRVSIQSDAMAIIDYTRQKTERSEFMNAVATFLQSSATVGQNAPDLIPLMMKLLQFGVAGFRVGKDIETVFDKQIHMMEQEAAAKKAAPKPPPPEVMKAQMDAKMKEQELKLDMAKQQAEMKLKQQEAGVNLQQDQLQFQQEMEQMRAEFELKMSQLIAEHELKMRTQEQAASINATIKTREAAVNEMLASRKANEESKEGKDE